MATQLHRVYDNFIWRIESLTPTNQTQSTRNFRAIDPLRIDPNEHTGLVRAFAVRWDSSDEALAPEDLSDRWGDHIFTVELYYPVGPQGFKWDDAHTIILQDRHDLAKELRDTSSYSGFNADNTSTDVGIKNRFRLGDELDRDESAWVFRTAWRVTVREVEV